MSAFDKRTYDVQSFREAILDVFDHIDDLRGAARGGLIDKAFSERIMLAVTQVNGCRYCSYAHARMALRAGLAEDEIRDMLAGEFTSVPEGQLTALAFAQHYAESGGVPDPEARRRVIDEYGSDGTRHIEAYIRMITVGNLLGNTFDALLARFRGQRAADSSLWQELGVLLGGIVFLPEGLLRRALARRRSSSQPA
jgi:AhpD family alkylhydroperoxidase